MSNCCETPEAAAGADDRCRQCGETGRLVLRETMESLLKPEALAHLRGAPYYFDRTPGCKVVYFSNEATSYFEKNSLSVRVSSKETDSSVPLCYCFGHTAETVRDEIIATGRSSVTEKIAAEVQAGNCFCEVRNPSGTCCLGDVNRAVHQIENEVRVEEPLAHLEKG